MTTRICHFAEDFHDHLLDADTARAFEEHLATCGQCRSELQEIRAIDQTVANAWMHIAAPKTLAPGGRGSCRAYARGSADAVPAEVTPAARRRDNVFSHRFWPIAAAVLVLASAALVWSMSGDRGERIVRTTGDIDLPAVPAEPNDPAALPARGAAAAMAPVAMRGSTPLYALADFASGTPGAPVHSSPELTVFVAFPETVTRPLSDKEQPWSAH